MLTTWTTTIVEADKEMAEMLGVDVARLVGKTLAGFIDLPGRSDFRARLSAIPKDGGYDDWPLRLRHADNSCRPVVANVKCAPNGSVAARPHLRWSLRIDGTGTTSVVRDALEESIGRFTHDLAQPLAAIVSYARGCLLRAERNALKDEDLKMILERIAAEALRAGDMIRDFRRKDLEP